MAKFKAFFSLLLAFCFLVVTVSGLALVWASKGHAAHLGAESFWGLSRWQWAHLHTISGFVLVGLVIIHLFLNGKMWRAEWRAWFAKRG